MTPKLRLSDLFAGALNSIEWYIQQKYITRRLHPELPYAILNYTEQCQFQKKWDLVTRKCRGLIYDINTGEVLARPFEKFFNYAEYDTIDDDAVGVAYDKLDGSLGILYPTREGWAVATRGSFESDQAQWATEHWQKNYADVFEPNSEYTYLFEIIYPENRIVLDYGVTEDLFLLDVLNTYSGLRTHDVEWPGPRPEVLKHDITLGEAVELGDRENREGIVFVEYGSGRRVKVKQQDYIEKHKAKFGLTARVIWDHLRQRLHGPDGSDEWAKLLAQVPAEYHNWCSHVQVALINAFEELRSGAYATFNEIEDQLGKHYTRKEFAEIAKQVRLPAGLGPAAMFLILDGRSEALNQYIWSNLKPSANWRPHPQPDMGTL